MGDHTSANDPQTGDSLSAQHAGNLTSEPEMRDQQDQDAPELDNPDDSIGGPPTGEHVDDTGGLTKDAQMDQTTCATAERAQ
jgi:hypothetical protein